MQNKQTTRKDFNESLKVLNSIKGGDIKERHIIALSLIVDYIGKKGHGHTSAFSLGDGRYIHSMSGDSTVLVNMFANRMLSEPDYMYILNFALICVTAKNKDKCN